MSRNKIKEVAKSIYKNNDIQKSVDVFNAFISINEIRSVNESNRNLISIKDNLVTKKGVSTAGSKSLYNYESPFDATVVLLLKQNNFSVIGKTNMDEFGLGSSTTNFYFGSTINPRFSDEKRICGGSSGGCAASIAGNMCLFGIGTDTGGSVRMPASYCNIFGFKPSYGRISRWGVIPYSQSLDTVGIMAKDIAKIKEVYGILDKYDEKDPTSIPNEYRVKRKNNNSYYTIGVPREFLLSELSSEVKKKWLDVLISLKRIGHKIVSVSIPTIKKLIAIYKTISCSEVASNLSRFDGLKYGYSTSKKPQTFLEYASTNRSDSFDLETQKRIILGNFININIKDNFYLKALKNRYKLIKEFNDVFECQHMFFKKSEEKIQIQNKCDFLLFPTTSKHPEKITEYCGEKETISIDDILLFPASLACLPSISIPVKNCGLQVVGQFCDDENLLDFSDKIVKITS